jgi:cysteinyl-tRNA synthetase
MTVAVKYSPSTSSGIRSGGAKADEEETEFVKRTLTTTFITAIAALLLASDRIRDDLIAKGVEVMDGDPLGWDWKLNLAAE